MFSNIPGYNWKEAVASTGDLPLVGNSLGDARIVTSSSTIYIWTGSAWTPVSGGGGGVAFSAVTGSPFDNANLSASLVSKVTIGGDTLGSTLTLGTNDAQELAFETANTQRFHILNNASTLRGRDDTAGAAVTLSGGNGSAGIGGNITLRAGTSSTGQSGAIWTLTAGASNNTTNQGFCQMTGVTSQGASGKGGDIRIIGGQTTAGATGGDVTIRAGYAAAGAGPTGNLILKSGTGTNGTDVVTVDGSFQTIFNQLTATTVPYLDSSKAIKSSAVTPTELGYLSGVSSAIQTQLGLKANAANPALTGIGTWAEGSLTGTQTGFTLSGTTTAGTSETQIGQLVDITTSGSATGANHLGMRVRLNSGGYTGAGFTAGLQFINNTTGSGNDPWNSAANFGVIGLVGGSNGSGTNVGGMTYVVSANKNIGFITGIDAAPSGSNGTNVGYYASVHPGNGTTDKSAAIYGVLSSGAVSNLPNGTIAAIVANNDNTTHDIFRALDNGSSVFGIQDGGKINTNQTSAATIPGTVNAKMPIYDASGSLVGYIPIYDAIT